MTLWRVVLILGIACGVVVLRGACAKGVVGMCVAAVVAAAAAAVSAAVAALVVCPHM